jgi:hypothetical protein
MLDLYVGLLASPSMNAVWRRLGSGGRFLGIRFTVRFMLVRAHETGVEVVTSALVVVVVLGLEPSVSHDSHKQGLIAGLVSSMTETC